VRKELEMGAEKRIEEAVGQLASGSSLGLRGRPIGVAADSVEGRLGALEGDIAKLYDGLVSAQRQIDDLTAKTLGP
jgi:hypothetical protein